MIDIFENFIIAYVDSSMRAFAWNNTFSEINVAVANEIINADDAGIVKASIENFMKDYDSWENYFSRDKVICAHLQDFKQKIGRIELIKGANIASMNIGNTAVN